MNNQDKDMVEIEPKDGGYWVRLLNEQSKVESFCATADEALSKAKAYLR